MKRLYAYAHTHWDREWYHPFERFRLYLHQLLKELLCDLESGRLPCFYLDGQAIVITDVLALEPELGPRMAALMQEGKLAAGPWYVLPDEMLVCGESLVRNLKLGLDTISQLGRAELVGYSPDTFGHSQDLPRILNGFHIKSAFVWRGVPPLSGGPVFRWLSPDGSSVLAFHLKKGYYQTSLIESALKMPQSKEASLALSEAASEVVAFELSKLKEELLQTVEEAEPFPSLYPIGADHTAPPAALSQAISEISRLLKDSGVELSLSHLSEFAALLVKEVQTQPWAERQIAGELRDNSASRENANAFLLPGVLSSRLYLKRANSIAEMRLFRFAEPYFSYLALSKTMEYPALALRLCLGWLLENHPHDSICGCSVDAVHDEMMLRYAKQEQLLLPLIERSKFILAGQNLQGLHPDDPVLQMPYLKAVNPGSRNFTGLVSLEFFSLEEEKVKDSPFVQVLESQVREELFEGWGIMPYYRKVRANKALLWIEKLPPWSELSLNRELLFASKPAQKDSVSFQNLRAGDNMLDNGILKVTVSKKGGITVIHSSSDGNRKYHLEHKIRDTADGGDTYNYDPLPQDKAVYARLLSARLKENGPLLSSLVLKYQITIHEMLNEQVKPDKNGLTVLKKAGKALVHEMETELILKKGSKILEFESRFPNASCGHRLEVLFSTGKRIEKTYAENHFSLAERLHYQLKATKLPVERGQEATPDRYAAQRFVLANEQLFLSKGLPEYAVEEEYFCFTLLRSIDRLSRGRMQSRGGGAGPHLHVPGAACKGLNLLSYAWAPLEKQDSKEDLSRLSIEAYELAQAYEQEIAVCFSAQMENKQESLLSSENPAVRLVASYLSGQGESVFFLRLLNVSPLEQSTKLICRFPFQTVNFCRLDEEVLEQGFAYRQTLEESFSDESSNSCALEIKFTAWELKTLKFRLAEKPLEKTAGLSVRANRTRRVKSKSG